MSEVKLTSVKVISELYNKFKNETIENEFSLQKLVNRTLDRFVYDEDFRKEILEHQNLHQSGSKF
jgi:hypothetical protein|tara:strand:- start:1072 stop:1266 length:195 start_codon:yes stop_codon:yes gene_type:complete